MVKVYWPHCGIIAGALLLAGCSVQPERMTTEQIRSEAAADMASLFEKQEALEVELGLHDAMARALKYNVERRLALMETAVASGQLNLASYDLLPKVAASAGYTMRNNEDSSFSRDPTTGAVATTPTVSRDRRRTLADATVSWNVLDFGLSYIRAKQQADRVLVSEERRRKAVQNLIQDVRYAYWRAAAAEALLPETQRLIGRVEQALERAQQAQDMRLAPVADMVAYRRELIDTLRRLEQQRDQLSLARVELATLMNLQPGTEFSLKMTDLPSKTPEDLRVAAPAMELLALTQRPELVGERYMARIGQNESYASLLALLPGIDLSASRNYDSSGLLLHNNWQEATARATLNLFRIASMPDVAALNEKREEYDITRRRTLSVAVITQVNLAMQSFAIARKGYERSLILSDLERQALGEAQKGAQTRTGTEMALVRAEIAALNARLDLFNAHADLQRSIGQVENSVGLDPLPSDLQMDNLPEIRQALDEQFSRPLSQRLRENLVVSGVLPPTVYASRETGADGDKTTQ